MKILQIHSAYKQPGGEDIVVEQERLILERARHTVVLYRRDNREADGYSGMRRLVLAKQVVWAADSRREVADLLRRHKPDVVHIHNTFVMISPSVYSACYEAGVPIVQTLHNYRLTCPAGNCYRDGKVCEDCAIQGLWQGIRHKCYRESAAATATVALMLAVHRNLGTWTSSVTCYIALTEFARRKFITAGLPPDRIVVKPNFITSDVGPRAGCGEYAIYVGRLSPEKGVQTLARAWQRLQYPIPLVIIGGGPSTSDLQRQVATAGLTNVLFEGRVSHDEVLRRIQHAKFLILPSGCYENFPMSIVEAFACGIPVICSGHGAMKELVRDGGTGLHFAPGNSEDLARKCEWAWSHAEELGEMGIRAREEYESTYTAERNYAQLMDIYERLVPPAGMQLSSANVNSSAHHVPDAITIDAN